MPLLTILECTAVLSASFRLSGLEQGVHISQKFLSMSRYIIKCNKQNPIAGLLQKYYF